MSESVLKRKLLSKNENYITLLNIIGTLIYQGINFILTPYLTRALNIEGYGIVSVYTSWVTVLVPIVSLTSMTVIPHIKMYINKEEQHKYISSLLGLSLIAFLLIFGLSLIFLPLLASAMQFTWLVVILLLLQSFGISTVNFAVAYCVQYQKTIFQFLITISLSILTSVISIFLIQTISADSEKYMGRIIGYSLPNIAVAVVIYFYFIRKSKSIFDKKVWAFALPICVPIIFHLLSNVLLSQSSRIILQKAVGFEPAGIYSFIFTIASLISVLWVAINNAWVPIYYKMLGEGKNEVIKQRGKRYLFFYTSIFCGFMLVSPEILRIMGGKEYNRGIPLMPLISFSMYLIFMYSFSINYKTICKKTISIAIGTVISAVVNIIANLLLIPKFELWGAAIATLLSYVVLFMFHQFTVKEKDYKYHFDIMFYAPGVIAALLSIAAFYALFDLWIVRWFLAFLVGVFLLLKIIKQRAIF